MDTVPGSLPSDLSRPGRLCRGSVVVLLAVAAVALGLILAVAYRTECVGGCRGRLVDCADAERWVQQATAGATAARRTAIRLRTRVSGVRATRCGDVDWYVNSGSSPIEEVLHRAGEEGYPVILTLRYVGINADDPSILLLVDGVEVRGSDDWWTVARSIR